MLNFPLILENKLRNSFAWSDLSQQSRLWKQRRPKKEFGFGFFPSENAALQKDENKEKLQECKRWFRKLLFTISILLLSKRFRFPDKCFCRYPEVSTRREGIILL